MWDVEIPYYVKVNMDDFVRAGRRRRRASASRSRPVVQEPRWGLYLTPGQAHLDGITALHFSRARYYDSDYARPARQQQVIRAPGRKYTDPATDIRTWAACSGPWRASRRTCRWRTSDPEP